MFQSHYLRIRLRRHSRITLSMPGGVERALKRGGLPTGAEALILDLGIWVPLKRHPAVASILAGLHPDPVRVVAPPQAEALAQPPAGTLLGSDQLAQSEEYVRFLARTMDQERRLAVRDSGGLRRVTGPARLIVAGGESADAGWRKRLLVVQRWAAAL